MGIPNQTSETLAEIFFRQIYLHVGSPKAILTDQGRNFISELMKKISKN